MIRVKSTILKTILLISLIVITAANTSYAGVVRGTILGDDSKQPLVGANIVLEGTMRGAATDLDGIYVIFNVDPGMYNVKITMLGYEPELIENVQVGEGTVVLDIELFSSSVKLEEVIITAGADKGSQERELQERLEKSSITDAISKEVLKKLPDPDVANVVRRATGVSVDKGDPIIRGLGVRYSKVTLNNASVSGTEPNRSAVSLELFPASMMNQVTISKSYLPDKNGEFAGGSVNMNTFNLPKNLEISVSMSSSLNTITTFKDFKTYEGGSMDFLGFDDGTRALPSLIESAENKIRSGGYDGYSNSEVAAFGKSFDNTWSAQDATASPNQSYSISIGNRTSFLGKPLGYMITGLYGNSYKTKSQAVNVYKGGLTPGTVADWHNYKFDLFTHAVNIGSMVAMKWHFSDLASLNYNFLYSHDTSDETRLFGGYNDDRQTQIKSTRLRFLEENTATNQLFGNIAMPKVLNSNLDYQLTYSRGTRYEPDTRETQYEMDSDGNYIYADETYSGSRIFNDLTDDTYSTNFDWTLRPGGKNSLWNLKTGVAAMYRDRESNYHRYEFEKGPGFDDSTIDLSATPEELFDEGNIHAYGWEISEYTRPNDSYTAEQTVLAGYLMTEIPVSYRFNISGGIRYEDSKQEVTAFEPFTATVTDPKSSELHTGDLLPAFNMRYMLKQRMNLRFAASQTLSRPDFRELAEFEFTDFVGGRAMIGNPDLKRAMIRNFDVRWEMVHGVADLLAVSVFYKNFQNPIETVIQNTAQNRTSFDNAKGANNYGVEFEIRQNLGLISERLRTFTLTTNLSLIDSKIELDETSGIQTSSERALAGQSPYLFNIGMGYVNPVYGTQVSLFYHTFGERISEVGANNLPDIYEQPHHDLDLTATHPLSKNLRLKLGARNILDHEISFEQGGKPTDVYNVGRTFSIGLSFNN